MGHAPIKFNFLFHRYDTEEISLKRSISDCLETRSARRCPRIYYYVDCGLILHF
jgi:hypothetical protein